MKRCALVLLLSLSACGETSETAASGGSGVGTFADEMPDDLPAGECRDTDGCETDGDDGTRGTTTGEPVDEPECERSEQCDGAGACVATWDDDVRGPFECRFACIPTLDESSWCSDDASCCERGDVCTPRGYCVPSEGDETGSSGGGSSGGGSSGG